MGKTKEIVIEQREAENLPAVLNEGFPVPTKPLSTIAIARTAKQRILATPTNTAYVKIKENFPYLESNYVDSSFTDIFPHYEVEILSSGVFQNYYVFFDVRVKAYITEDKYLQRVGTGSARIQVKTSAKEEFLKNGGTISPFDYVDFGNSRKSALTLAIKNAQERFGIGADITNRIILSKEETDRIREEFDRLLLLLDDPRDKNRYKEKWNSAKTPNDKLKILQTLNEITA